jgi:VanZ family protein
MAVIFLLSSQSGLRVSDDASIDRPIRTVAHMATFALLGGLILLAFVGRGRATPRTIVLAVGLTVLYAASDELHQSFVPDRTGRVEDVVIDAVGALLGVATTTWLLGRRARRGASVD